MAKEAFVTLATNDTYCQGAVVLAQSLRNHCTQKEITIMITPQVSPEARAMLENFFDHVFCVNVLDSEDEVHLALLTRPELGITFTKLHCWNLTQYSKCVFMDADTMVLQNIDNLFEHPELSAAPDVGWPDMFNSGVFVFEPSYQTYMALIQLAKEEGSFDGGDQGLLNTYFSDWRTSEPAKRLSFLYNMHSTATYTYSPAFAKFGKDTKVVHFIGSVKPWHHKYSSENNTLEQAQGPGIHEEMFLLQWWQLLTQAMKQYQDTSKVEPACSETPHSDNGHISFHCHAPLSPVVNGHQAGAVPPSFPQTGESGPEPPDVAREQQEAHHRQWQNAQIDYTGVDSFANIQQKLDRVLLAETEKSDAPVAKVGPPEPAPAEVPKPKGSSTDRNVPQENVAQGPLSAVTLSDHQRWKSGAIDYLGQDSFANIQARLDTILNDTTNTQANKSATTQSTGSASSLNTNNNNRCIVNDDSGSRAQFSAKRLGVKLKREAKDGQKTAVQPSAAQPIKADEAASLDVASIESDARLSEGPAAPSSGAPSITVSPVGRCANPVHREAASRPDTAHLSAADVSSGK